MIKTKMTVNGTEFSDYQNLIISKTMDEANASSSFNAIFDSPYGRHKSDFSVGQEVIIYADKDAEATTIIFKGILEKIVFSGEETEQTVELSGRDYTVRLMDITVEPIVFSETEISDIVKNILTNNNVPDITTTNVQNTGKTLKRIGFNHTPIFDALKQLADLAGFIFYVDVNKDLHFEQADTSSSGITLNNSNLIKIDYDKSRQGMANKIWVYGDRYLSEVPAEQFTMGSPLGGSAITLTYKPHNTTVTYLGNILKGAVEGMTLIPTSGQDYGVSFDDRQILFYSGGDFPNFPASGGSVIVNYYRDLPIVKYGQDDNSIALYGPKNLKIQDSTIKDPQTALDILKQKLNDVNPFNRVECILKGWYSILPGQTIDIQLDHFGLTDTLSILEVNYRLDKNSVQSENVLNLIINKKFLDITDKIKEINRRLTLLETQNLQDSDILSRLITSTGSMMIVGSRWNAYTSSVTGSAYHIYSTGFIPPINPFHLASGTNQGKLSGSPVGSAFGPFNLNYSGGYY
jgi:hypothetical protein